MKRIIIALLFVTLILLGYTTECEAAKKITVHVGESKTLMWTKKVPRVYNFNKIKWKVTKGKKNVEVHQSNIKYLAFVHGLKKGNAVIVVKYKGKKKQEFKIIVKACKKKNKKVIAKKDNEEKTTKKKNSVKVVQLTGISVEGPDHALDWNEFFAPKVTKIPSNAYPKPGYTYSYKCFSDNEKVAKIADSGQSIVAVGNGETTIHVKMYQYKTSKSSNEQADMTEVDISTSFNVKVSYQEYKGKYHYQIFPIHPEFTATNGDNEYFYYLKTDNPDPSTIVYAVEDPDGYQGGSKIVKGQYLDYYGYKIFDLGTEFEEIKSSISNDVYYRQTNKVLGGYILGLNIYHDESMSRDKTGTFKYNIYEKNVERLGENSGDVKDPRDYDLIYSYEFEVVDEDTLWNQEVQRIAKLSKERVQERCKIEGTELPTDETELFWKYCNAAKGIIWNDYSYYYVWDAGKEGGGVTSDGMPVLWVQSKVFTCWGAAALMSSIAKELGADKAGSYSVPGTIAHRNAKIIKNGETRHIDATPSGPKYRAAYTDDAGVYHEATYKVIDYSDSRFKAYWE